ncbi:preprotein translocase subunit SecY [Thermosipho melanesiensis]|uniref:Protein translocase subunit SecY n=2 Tax=Thermosipho melanesiensis TaxID=46541 RepID=A6LLN3_THEM4|nr:preprotein translocase subunit SecY [Thermosipho melanesiensis]ABR30834.1 preprotein translocase, SecY subunit [Thermosipho melanesiensis BI429]APT73954.1 preprotein translocase subunit SecY [Thermosipho melanesiensis]OOC35891.1 preprotein translocase subunit SecY [Thermosipho melanesiensis]OOC38393.1 preprotein translocase subunit SecY [Thermosipho melanesiensis]OOC38854.1 preprotein translocase subunit SecY [Thermosipho melanesiensis]
MWKALRNALKIPELRDRIVFTLLMLIVFRLGIYIPVPGVNLKAWGTAFSQMGTGAAGGLLSFYDVFTGGAFRRFSIFAMSVTPYINASIILQLLSSVIPSLKELLKEGEEGRKKFQRITRNLTVILGALQGFVVSFGLARSFENVLVIPLWTFTLLSTITLLAGTMFLLWIGDRITEKGIGNGISVLIFAGIVARYPAYFRTAVLGGLNIFEWIFLLGVMFLMVIGIIYVQQAERRIVVQYASRMVGRRIYGGTSTHIPIKVNHSGVIPIIFGWAIVSIPVGIAQFTNSQTLKSLFSMTSPLIITIYAVLIFFFTYFYSVVVFDPKDIAQNIKSYGGYIPGIRPGKPTEQYITRVLNRITFVGALFLVIIALVPYLVQGVTGVSIWLGGTSALIAVGVALDIAQQMEAHLIMRNYEGFVKKGKLPGRR